MTFCWSLSFLAIGKVKFLDFCQSNGYKMVFQFDLKLHFPDYLWSWASLHIFIDHICFLFCEIPVFSASFIVFFPLFLLIYRNSLSIFYKTNLFVGYVSCTYLLVYKLSFICFKLSFLWTEVFNVNIVTFIKFFPLWLMLLVSCLRNSFFP